MMIKLSPAVAAAIGGAMASAKDGALVQFDNSLNLGQLINILVLAIGCIGTFWALKSDVRLLGLKMDHIKTEHDKESTLRDLQHRDVQEELRKQTAILVEMGKYQERLNAIEARFSDTMLTVQAMKADIGLMAIAVKKPSH